MRVVKFGGSSLADSEQFEKVVAIMQADPSRRIVVTSAPGKRHAGDTKVTDLLIAYAEQVQAGQDPAETIAAISARYREIAQHYQLAPDVMAEIDCALNGLQTTNFATPAYQLAAFKAHGEKLNGYLLTAVLNACGTPATYGEPHALGLMVTDEPNDAEVLAATYANLNAYPQPEGILVVPGFYGYTAGGQIATFSRGGSDITGAILARGFGADLYENFTDVDGVFAADPRVVNQPVAIEKMTYREMRELSYGGFGVFHDEAILPAIEGQIPINLKSTNAPDHPGTMIVPEAGFTPQHAVTGIVSSDHFSAIYLHRYLLNKEVGFTLKLLQIFYDHGINYEHMPSGIDDLTVILDNRQLTPALRTTLCQEIQAKLHPDVLEWIDDYAITMIVGEGMAKRIGLIQRVLTPLVNREVHVTMINEGASQISLMLGTSKTQAKAAVQAVYNAFFIPVNQQMEG